MTRTNYHARAVRACPQPADSMRSQRLATLSSRFVFEELLEYKIKNMFRICDDDHYLAALDNKEYSVFAFFLFFASE